MHVAITGASSGIGLALTKVFGQYASKITLVARRKNILEKEAKYLGIPYYIEAVDLSQVASCTDWVDKAQDANGPIDIFINNAGMQLVGKALDHSEDQINMMMNLLSPLKMIQYLLPQMLNRQNGSIINIASMAAINSMPGMAHYCATKSGFAAFSESLRIEYGDQGIHILTVYPGPIATEMADKAQAKYDNALAKMLPAASAEEMAAEIYRYFKLKKNRLYFPHIYGLQSLAPTISQWFIERFAPIPKA